MESFICEGLFRMVSGYMCQKGEKSLALGHRQAGHFVSSHLQGLLAWSSNGESRKCVTTTKNEMQEMMVLCGMEYPNFII